MSRLAPPCIVPRARDRAPTIYRPAAVRHADPYQLFLGTYERFAPGCREVDEPGVVVVAVDEVTGTLVGVCGLRACFGRPVTAILGRHGRCDLVLWGDDIALRHIAIVIDPVVSWAEGARACYRAIDLRTSGGVIDEIGRPLQSFRADGPAVLRCGGQVLFVLPIGDPSDWPPSAKHAWEMLPQRIYLDECGGTARSHARTSLIFRRPAVRSAEELIAGDLAGTLEIEQPGHSSIIAFGTRALLDGVLLGRYDRCELLGDLDDSVSRVHAMLVRVGDRLVLVDLASSHGLGPIGGGRARVAELVDGAAVWLGRQTRLRWRDTCRLPERTPGPEAP